MEKINKTPRRGEVWLVKFKKSKETPKTYHPCLVISNNIQNKFNDLIIVVPITTNDAEKIEPFEVFLQNTHQTGLKRPSKVQLFFPATIDKELRLVEFLGKIDEETMKKVRKAWEIAFDWNNLLAA